MTDRVQVYPASFAQTRLWFLEQLVPGNGAYLVHYCMWLRGCPDVRALGRALEMLVERHEALRTVFGTRDGEPVQVVQPAEPESGSWGVLEVLEGVVSRAEVLGLLEERVRRPFDLGGGPLLRAVLVESEEEWALALCLHHIAADGWSMGVLLEELGESYGALVEGREPGLRAVEVDYADYAVWQREWLKGEVMARQLEHWVEELSGAPEVLELPFDHPRPAVQSFRGETLTFEVGGELTSRLRELGLERGSTLFMVLLAGFEVLLSRWSGQRDVVVGVPTAGRSRLELERVVGFFANTLALRTGLGGDPVFEEVLRRVRETALGAYANQEVPFEAVVERLSPRRELSHNPVFQVMFALQNAPVAGLRLAGLEVEPLEVDNRTSKFDLWLSVEEVGEGLRALLQYDAELFERGTVERLAESYVRVLEAVAADPRLALSRVPVPSDAVGGGHERHT